MIAKFVSMMMLLLLSALAGAQPVPVRCHGPLSEAQLTDMVKGSMPEPRIGQYVAACGIDFEPSEDAIDRLRSAGAPESVLAAVRAATGPTARKRKAESALWESIKDSQDAAVFEDYLRRYPEGQFVELARQKGRALRVADVRAEMERNLEAGHWDAADDRIRDLLRVVTADDEIRGWQQRVADGRDLDEIGKRADAAYARQDYATAAPLYQQLADAGRAGAMTNLGWLYENGRGVSQDDAQAVDWYRKAAEKGDPTGMRDLGSMYENGRGVVQDDAGMTGLGFMYAHGRGVARDDAQAIAWYRRAAEKGEATAMKDLGIMYQRGLGVTQDDTQAVDWYRKAADKGEPLAMTNLGVMYMQGRGVAQTSARCMRAGEEWQRTMLKQLTGSVKPLTKATPGG